MYAVFVEVCIWSAFQFNFKIVISSCRELDESIKQLKAYKKLFHSTVSPPKKQYGLYKSNKGALSGISAAHKKSTPVYVSMCVQSAESCECYLALGGR